MGHSNIVTTVAFSPDSKHLASGSADNSIILWDISDPTAPSQIGELSGHTNVVTTVAFSPDGKHLASGSLDTSIILWNISDPAEPFQTATLLGSSNSIASIAFSPDGKHLASGSYDTSIILWEISDSAAPSQIATLMGHSNIVYSVAFNPDGKGLASGSADNSIILWDISDPTAPSQLAILSGHSNIVITVAFSPDGKQLASGSSDQSIILWNVDLQTWIERACQRVGRNFSIAEWEQYFSDVEYRKTCEQWPKHWSFYNTIAKETLLNDNDSNRIQKTIDRVRDEMELDSSIEKAADDSSVVVAKIVRDKISAAQSDNSQLPEAIELLQQSRTSDLDIGFAYFNFLCLYGSLDGYAAQVLPLCEHAVDMEPMSATGREGRGMARAITGDYAGAMEDYRFFIAFGAEQGFSHEYILQREQWLAELEAGTNPFTPELLEMLKPQ
jgi:WD40 repeat protein